MVWSSQLGAKEKHVEEAAQLMEDSRARHFWDGDQWLGKAYQPVLDLSQPAWDVWLIFGPDARWPADGPPAPSWWEHQLRELPKERRLDAKRFAVKTMELVPRAQAAAGR